MKKQKQNSHTYKQNNHILAVETRPRVGWVVGVGVGVDGDVGGGGWGWGWGWGGVVGWVGVGVGWGGGW